MNQQLSITTGNAFRNFFSVPHRVFLILALFFGTGFILITPPFQSPDEFNHFYRAYSIAEGYLIGQKVNNRVGAPLPQGIVEVTKPFLSLRWLPNRKINWKEIIDAFRIPLTREQMNFVDFPNTAIYPPVAYLPQALIILLVKWWQPPPLLIFYLARICSLICWALLVYQAIKIIPGFKWLFVVLALLPMSLFENSSVSADVFTNGLSFLLIAYIFKCAFANEFAETKDLLLIIFLSVVLASTKIVYTPIALLVIIIPAGKFKTVSLKYFFIAVVSVCAFSTMIFWSSMVNEIYTPYHAYNAAYRGGIDLLDGIDIHRQIGYIKTHPHYPFEVIPHTIVKTYGSYLPGYIGIFGWLDTPLPVWLVVVAYFGIFIVLFLNTEGHIKLSWSNRAVLFIVGAILVVLILFSQLLNWTYAGDEIINGVQGRYLIPVFPLMFMVLHGNFFSPTKLISTIVISISVFILSISTFTLYARYYVPLKLPQRTVTCDAEKYSPYFLYYTDDPAIKLENGYTMSGEKARSGSNSARLDDHNHFAFTLRIYDGDAGDTLLAEVWRRGSTGSLVFSGNNGHDFYLSTDTVAETDKQGWQKIKLQYVLEKNMRDKEIDIYVWNDSNQTEYFDDFSVTHRRKK